MTTIHDVAPRLARAMRERNEEVVREWRKSWPVLVSELVNDFCGSHGAPTRFGELHPVRVSIDAEYGQKMKVIVELAQL